MFFAFLTAGNAQAKWELGFNGGTGFYLGDNNRTIFNEFNPTYAGFIRVISNVRWGTKLQITSGTMEFPSDVQLLGAEQRYMDFSAREEFNFFEYGLLNSESWTRFFSPYIFAGFGVASFSDGSYSVLTSNIPFGFGLKYKVLPKVNLGVEWAMHKLISDEVDGVDNPYSNSESRWTNKDWVSLATISLSFDFGNKNSYCR